MKTTDLKLDEVYIFQGAPEDQLIHSRLLKFRGKDQTGLKFLDYTQELERHDLMKNERSTTVTLTPAEVEKKMISVIGADVNKLPLFGSSAAYVEKQNQLHLGRQKIDLAAIATKRAR